MLRLEQAQPIGSRGPVEFQGTCAFYLFTLITLQTRKVGLRREKGTARDHSEVGRAWSWSCDLDQASAFPTTVIAKKWVVSGEEKESEELWTIQWSWASLQNLGRLQGSRERATGCVSRQRGPGQPHNYPSVWPEALHAGAIEVSRRIPAPVAGKGGNPPASCPMKSSTCDIEEWGYLRGHQCV